MSQNITLNSGMAQEKLYALMKKPTAANNPGVEQQANAVSQEINRASNLRWAEVKSEGKTEGDLKILASKTSSELASSTVTLPDAVKASYSSADLLDTLRKRFVTTYEKACELSFHFNRLTAKVGEFMAGTCAHFLSPEEKAKIKERVRQNMISQNRAALSQVIYDETMLEIVA